MKKVFIIDGGAGRAICAIPALEYYVKSHPSEEIKIFVYGWDTLFWSNPTLQSITFNINDKGTFDKHFKDADAVVSPEIYRLPDYYNQKVSMTEAFDILINGTNNNLDPLKLYSSKSEMLTAKKTIEQIKNQTQKSKVIVFQPFGSTARFEKFSDMDEVFDDSSRSMNLLMYSTLVKELSNDYAIILFAEPQFHFSQDTLTLKMNLDLRMWSAIINQADYFIGCDSVGQHMARSHKKSGTVIFGSTFPKNVSYPDWFQIIDKDKETRIYSPLRLNEIDANMANRLNEECMNYSPHEISNIVSLIKTHIKKTTR